MRRTQPKKLDFANILGAPDVGGIGMELFAKLATERSNGELTCGSTAARCSRKSWRS
jgi:hypothetical protein